MNSFRGRDSQALVVGSTPSAATFLATCFLPLQLSQRLDENAGTSHLLWLNTYSKSNSINCSNGYYPGKGGMADMEFSITVLPGDGVGPEVVAEGAKALKAIGKAFNHDFKLNYGSIGAKAYETEGEALSSNTMALCK